jgi:hypothetical protein
MVTQFRETHATAVTRDDVRDLLRNGFLLLPAPVDSDGQLGPLLTHFLWQASRNPLPRIPCPSPILIVQYMPPLLLLS